jgi:dethiobiotin synthetase
VDALERRGLPIAAVVLNRTTPDDDPTVALNARWVIEMTGAQVLGPGPFVADPTERPAALSHLLARLLS